MAGILITVGRGLIGFPAIRHILNSTHPERAVFIVTFTATLTVDLVFAILLGILLSLVLYLLRVSRPNIVSRMSDPHLPKRKFSTVAEGNHRIECPQLHIMRIDGSLFFGSVAYVREKFARLARQKPLQKHLAIVAQGITFADIAGADVLANEAERRAAAGGGRYPINAKAGLWESLEKCHALVKIDSHHVFQTKSAALHAIFQKMDKSVCSTCTVRAFNECAGVPYTGNISSGRLDLMPAPVQPPDAEAQTGSGVAVTA